MCPTSPEEFGLIPQSKANLSSRSKEIGVQWSGTGDQSVLRIGLDQSPGLELPWKPHSRSPSILHPQ